MSETIIDKGQLILGKENIVTLNAVVNVPIGPTPCEPDPGTAFTYSLSLGRICRASKKFGADNAYECGVAYGHTLPH